MDGMMNRRANKKWLYGPILTSLVMACSVALTSCTVESIAGNESHSAVTAAKCDVEFVVLGIGQDGGAPQIGNPHDPAWANPDQKLYAAAGALIDHRDARRFLFEATPDMREQINLLDAVSRGSETASLGLSGIFLTHAHIGHYAGLIFTGHESIGAKNINVYALERMKSFLENNGPWDQLVRYENIKLNLVLPQKPVTLGGGISVTAYKVPHRDEYSETAGFVIQGPSKKLLFLPDLDDWDRWASEYDTRIEDMIGSVDAALLDATFYDNHELPGRDMSKIPHPRVTESMDRFESLPQSDQDKVRFFHINHTNKIRFETSVAYKSVINRGFKIAKQGERICLD